MTSTLMRRTATFAAALAGVAALGLFAPDIAQAEPVFENGPSPLQLNMTEAATEIMERTRWLHNFMMVIMTLVTLFVFALLGYTVWRFDAKRNKTPSRTTHNTLVEVVWTVVPVIILVVIAIPSLPLLFDQQVTPKPDVTVKAIGHQWRWEYMYDINDEEVYVDSSMVGLGALNADEAAEELESYGFTREHYTFAATAPLVVPAGKIIRVEITASDVLHSWTVPAFGVKQDAVPGRLEETWFKVDRPGTYYGQCSELCGKDHSYMPIMVKVVPAEEYEAELQAIYDEYADSGVKPAIRVAASE